MTVTLDKSLEKLGAWPARLTTLFFAEVTLISSLGTICLWQAWLGPGRNPRPEHASWEACSLCRVLVTLLSACVFSGVSSKLPWAWGCCCKARTCTSLHMLSGGLTLILWKSVLSSRNLRDVNGGSAWNWGEGFSKWLENVSLLTLQASAKAAGGGRPDSGASPGPLVPVCIPWLLRCRRRDGRARASSSMSDRARRELGLPGSGGRETSSGETQSYSSPESTSTGGSRPWTAPSGPGTSCFTSRGSWPSPALLTAKSSAGLACSFKMEKSKLPVSGRVFFFQISNSTSERQLEKTCSEWQLEPWLWPYRTRNCLSAEAQHSPVPWLRNRCKPTSSLWVRGDRPCDTEEREPWFSSLMMQSRLDPCLSNHDLRSLPLPANSGLVYLSVHASQHSWFPNIRCSLLGDPQTLLE